MDYNCNSILDKLGINYISEGTERQVDAISSINEARESDLIMCYYEKDKGVSMISQSNAGIILCAKSLQGRVHPKDARQQLFFLDNPRYAFVKIMNQLYNKKNTTGISARSVISETAKIGSGCNIGDFTVVGDDCIIGDNTIIGTKVSLQNCHCGNNSIIQSGVTIGEDGFSFERNADGELERFPHIRGNPAPAPNRNPPPAEKKRFSIDKLLGIYLPLEQVSLPAFCLFIPRLGSA